MRDSAAKRIAGSIGWSVAFHVEARELLPLYKLNVWRIKTKDRTLVDKHQNKKKSQPSHDVRQFRADIAHP
jgi:hypothetical protein